MKPWYKSKTMVLNLVMATLSVLAMQAEAFGEYAEYVLLANALGNLWLRAITTEGLSLVQKK